VNNTFGRCERRRNTWQQSEHENGGEIILRKYCEARTAKETRDSRTAGAAGGAGATGDAQRHKSRRRHAGGANMGNTFLLLSLVLKTSK